jgi:hypothetical protein
MLRDFYERKDPIVVTKKCTVGYLKKKQMNRKLNHEFYGINSIDIRTWGFGLNIEMFFSIF